MYVCISLTETLIKELLLIANNALLMHELLLITILELLKKICTLCVKQYIWLFDSLVAAGKDYLNI